jgi:hypothetical protein
MDNFIWPGRSALITAVGGNLALVLSLSLASLTSRLASAANNKPEPAGRSSLAACVSLASRPSAGARRWCGASEALEFTAAENYSSRCSWAATEAATNASLGGCGGSVRIEPKSCRRQCNV